MRKTILDNVEKKLDEVDACCDNDWVFLGENLTETILTKPELVSEFTDKQREVIIAVCRETFHAACIAARAYAFTSIAEVIRETDV